MGYPFPLRHWDNRSWIRSKPFSTASLEGQPFPSDLVPLSKHSELESRPELQRKLLAYRLLSHLRFTTILELEHVNPVCSQLGRGVSPADLNQQEKNDALRIYCDEGGHALFVELLSKEVEIFHGVNSNILGQPDFDRQMKQFLYKQTTVSVEILHHFFVAVSETLVTKILRDIPHNPLVAPAVRAVIGDHANDEASHSVYFRWYFPRLWETLDVVEKLEIGSILPEFIWTFLQPDRNVELAILQALGWNPKEALRIWEETYTEEAIAESVRHSAIPTLEIFRKAGVFENPEIQAAFAGRKLFGRDSKNRHKD